MIADSSTELNYLVSLVSILYQDHKNLCRQFTTNVGVQNRPCSWAKKIATKKTLEYKNLIQENSEDCKNFQYKIDNSSEKKLEYWFFIRFSFN